MKKNLTELVFILDRSGSMQGLEGNTIGGFNAMIEKQKKEKRVLYRIYCPERIKERFFHRASFGYCFWAGLSGAQTDRKRDSLSDIGNFTDRLYGADRILQFK